VVAPEGPLAGVVAAAPEGPQVVATADAVAARWGAVLRVVTVLAVVALLAV
jgi:hypothetical protein